MTLRKLIILLLVITSFTSFSQNTKKKLEISKAALILIKKDLQICDSLKIAYIKQRNTLTSLADSNILLLTRIEGINKKAVFWQSQINKQMKEIAKLQRRRKNRLIWLGVGVLGGVVAGVYISN